MCICIVLEEFGFCFISFIISFVCFSLTNIFYFRCERASILMNDVDGVGEVYQLKGGIHRYMEEYGDDGLWKGLF